MTALARDIGPAMAVFASAGEFTIDTLRRLVEIAHGSPLQEERPSPEDLERGLRQWFERTVTDVGSFGPVRSGGIANYRWSNPVGDERLLILKGEVFASTMCAVRARKFTRQRWMVEDSEEFFAYFQDPEYHKKGRLRLYDKQETIDEVLRVWKRMTAVFAPRLAIVDDYRRRILPELTEDPFARAWGVTVYGPELAERLGRERLRSVPAFRVEEMEWGGVWVQAAQNPFASTPAERRRVEKHLSLKAFAASVSG